MPKIYDTYHEELVELPPHCSLQWARAFALAVAHNHAWAQVFLTFLATGEPVSQAAVHEWTVAHSVPGPAGAGETAPTLVGDGTITHLTGTGRLRWNIAPGGDAEICILRPTGWCVSAHIAADGGAEIIFAQDPERAACRRHLRVLGQCFRSLAVASTACRDRRGSLLDLEALIAALPDDRAAR